MKDILTKFLSRKFLTALGALYVAYVGVTNPTAESNAQSMADTIVASIMSIVPIVYMIMQGKIDNGKS